MIRCLPYIVAGAVGLGGGGFVVERFGGGFERVMPYGWRALAPRAAAARGAPARKAVPVPDRLGEVCWWEAGGYYGPAFLPVSAGGFLPAFGGYGGHGFGGDGHAAGHAGPGGGAGLGRDAPGIDLVAGPGAADGAQPGDLPAAPPAVPPDLTAPGGPTPQDVPEPGSALLLAGGLAALLLRRRA